MSRRNLLGAGSAALVSVAWTDASRGAAAEEGTTMSGTPSPAVAQTVVLVHGAWSGPWGWHRITPILEAAGHTVVAPALPSHGADRLPVFSATLEAFADVVLAAVDAAPGQVTLVGHSMGGAVISVVAEARPDRIQRAIYLSAYLLRDGESIFQLAGSDADSQLGPALQIDETAGVAGVDPDAFVELFFHDCGPDVKALGRSLLLPEPLGPLATPIRVTDGNFGRVPRTYVLTTGDRVVSPSLQRRMIDATPVEQVIELDTGHASYLAQPERLAEIIAGAS